VIEVIDDNSQYCGRWGYAWRELGSGCKYMVHFADYRSQLRDRLIYDGDYETSTVVAISLGYDRALLGDDSLLKTTKHIRFNPYSWVDEMTILAINFIGLTKMEAQKKIDEMGFLFPRMGLWQGR